MSFETFKENSVKFESIAINVFSLTVLIIGMILKVRATPPAEGAGAKGAGATCPEDHPYVYGNNGQYCCIADSTANDFNTIDKSKRGTKGFACAQKKVGWGGGYTRCTTPPCKDNLTNPAAAARQRKEDAKNPPTTTVSYRIAIIMIVLGILALVINLGVSFFYKEGGEILE